MLNTYEYSINKNKYDIKYITSFEDINYTITTTYNGNAMSSNKISPIHLNEENNNNTESLPSKFKKLYVCHHTYTTTTTETTESDDLLN